jgi:hypothetical protein
MLMVPLQNPGLHSFYSFEDPGTVGECGGDTLMILFIINPRSSVFEKILDEAMEKSNFEFKRQTQMMPPQRQLHFLHILFSLTWKSGSFMTFALELRV